MSRRGNLGRRRVYLGHVPRSLGVPYGVCLLRALVLARMRCASACHVSGRLRVRDRPLSSRGSGAQLPVDDRGSGVPARGGLPGAPRRRGVLHTRGGSREADRPVSRGHDLVQCTQLLGHARSGLCRTGGAMSLDPARWSGCGFSRDAAAILLCTVAMLGSAAGCGTVEGTPCDPFRIEPCPANFACMPGPGGRSVCLRHCERRSDCSNGRTCLRLPMDTPPPSRGVCRLGGSLSVDAACTEFDSDDCGDGLICSGVHGDRCRHACDPGSPHGEDRACPTGSTCDLTDGFGAAACLLRCDPIDPISCSVEGGSCIRVTHPTEGDIGLCMTRGWFMYCEGSSEPCPSGRVCVGGECLDAVDAPARPFPVWSGVPALVD